MYDDGYDIRDYRQFSNSPPDYDLGYVGERVEPWADDAMRSLEQNIHNKIMLEQVMERILFDERQINIIFLRYGLAGNVPKTLDEVSRVMNISPERVRQIEEAAIKKLLRWASIEKD